MFDETDVAQHAALITHATGRPASRALALKELRRADRKRGLRWVRPATGEALRLVQARTDATLALIDLEGLPARTYAVAEMLASGSRFGDVCVALGITRHELDAERERLKRELL